MCDILHNIWWSYIEMYGYCISIIVYIICEMKFRICIPLQAKCDVDGWMIINQGIFSKKSYKINNQIFLNY